MLNENAIAHYAPQLELLACDSANKYSRNLVYASRLPSTGALLCAPTDSR
ncbi:hypothetical protein [Scytonema millei]|uniref:Uncharacterized protein n=1 Tax=Scytonema millei VB511283 TaxID=1245923 RepID=A0A9X5I7Z2_9CYAN|nr:hypothetical protein [Scytonema millei]NHC38205.1 hypothetical protein [Scytonema millei VB511283]